MLNDRWSPSSPAKVKMTHSTPGARSIAATDVGSHAKKKITIASTANTTAEKNAVRVLNSIARSLRAMSSAAEKRLGSTRHQLSIGRRVLGRVEHRARLVAHEAPVAHNRGVRREL